jgi:hypothetical protein
METTPLADAMAVGRAVFPLSLELEPPGEARAVVHLETDAAGELRYSAEGEITAAAFRAGDMLPPARNIRAAYALDRSGALEIRIVEGRVAEGPLSGKLTTPSIDPLAPLRFEGSVSNAALGQLLAGFVERAAERVRGPADVRSSLSVDLSDETFTPADIHGKLALDVREASLPGWDLEAEVQNAVRKKLGSLAEIAALLDDRLAEEPAPSEPAGEKLLDSLRAQLDFDASPWRLEELELVSGGLRASGRGSFDAAAGRVALELVATLDEAATKKLVGRVEELVALTEDGRLRLPLRVEGDVLGPAISVDAGNILARKLETETGAPDVKGAVRGLLEKELRKRLDKSRD